MRISTKCCAGSARCLACRRRASRIFCRWGETAIRGAPAKGKTYPRGQFPIAFVRVVTDGYIGAMGIPLVEGRDFSGHDTPESRNVVLVNETLAHKLWPGVSALGQVMRACGDRIVVGVVGDVRHLAPEQG